MRPAFSLILTVVVAVLLSLPAAAQGRRADGVQPLDQILPQIRRTHPGDFFDADGPTENADGSQHYHLKWMTPEGRVEWLDTDARTGRVLRRSPGRDNFDGPDRPRNFAPGYAYPPPQAYGGRFRGNDEGDGGRDWRRGGYARDRGQGYGAGRSYGNRDSDGRGGWRRRGR
jgi:hypothetical protein